MSRTRKITAKHVFLHRDADSSWCTLSVSTAKGAHYDVRFCCEDHQAACAIGTLASLLARDIENERQKHARYGTRLAQAHAVVAAAIKGGAS